jgi:hypothetical protein
MDHKDKEPKNYVVKVKKYDTGTPEEFLRWRLVLNEQIKNHGYSGSNDIITNLAQAMLAGCSLEAVLNEQRAQETKKQNTQGKGAKRVHSAIDL